MATYTLAIGVGRYVLNKRLTLVDSGALTAAASLTRNSTATYWDSAGELQTAAIDTARTDYDPSDDSLRGLLVEESRTNLVTQSEDLTHGDWAKGNVTVSTFATTKYPNAFTLTENSNSGVHQIEQEDTFTTSGTHKVGQRWAVTAGTRSHAVVSFSNAAQGSKRAYAIYDLSDGSLVFEETGASVNFRSSITDVGDGWYEIEVLADDLTASSGKYAAAIAIADDSGNYEYTGDGSGTIHVAAPQAEEDVDFLSSYIPTTTAAATREDDDVTATVGGSFSDPVSYEIVATAGADQDAVLYQADDGTENNRLRIARVSGNLRVIVTDGGTEQANLDLGAIADFTEFTVRVAFAANDIAASLNGAASVTDSSATMPSGLANRRLGADTSGDHWNGWIKDKVEHRQRLDNTWLETGIATLIGDVALNRSFYLAAAQGSYTLSGQSVGLIGSFILAADQGAYTLSGQAVGLNRSFYLSLAQGAYSLTGQDLTFLRLWFAQAQAGNAWTEQAQAGNAWTEQ